MSEKIQIDYNHQTVYELNDTVVVGATTETGKRTVPAPSGDVAYVRKFGVQFSETDITTIDAPSANLTVKVYALDGTLIGSRANGGAFQSEGSVSTAQGIYIEFEASGAATVDTSLSATFPTAGVVSLKFSAETMANSETFRFYMSSTGSSYYDAAMKYGGARHTPALDDSDLPYFHPYDAYAALDSTNDGVEILDSETYSFPYKDSGGTWRDELDMSRATTYLYSTDGQTPTIMGVIGASTEREVSAQWNNTTAIYFNENGDSGGDGTWHAPFDTYANALAGRGSLNIVYGGTGATATGSSFDESMEIDGAFTLEADYGYILNNNYTGDSSHAGVELANDDAKVFGLKIDRFNAGYCVEITEDTDDGYIQGCTILNGGFRSQIDNIFTTGHINYNEFSGGTYGIEVRVLVTSDIKYNIFHDMSSAILVYNQTATTITQVIKNNIIYDCSHSGIYLYNDNSGENDITIENNTIYNNTSYGIYSFQSAGTMTITAADNIVYGNGMDLYRSGTQPTITYSNYGTNAAAPNDWTAGVTNITSDPNFCKTTSPYRLGLSADSLASHLELSTEDIGAQLQIIEINADDIEINGINFDGNDQFNNAVYIADVENNTGAIIKWCNVYNFQGIAIDLYDNNVDTDATISNNKIYNNGNGLKLSLGGNTCENNCIYGNTIFGIWSDYTGQIFNHNVFYNNQYGLYLESNSASIIVKNSIFYQNSLYGIYSDISLITTYCDHVDAVTSNVDISDSTNITDDPLFVNTNSGSEDFHLKSIAGGYVVNSACIDAGESDIGAWQTTRTITDDSWDKYTLEHNPRNMNETLNIKGAIDFEDILGNIDNYGKSDRIVLPLSWSTNSYTTSNQRLKIRYFSSLIPTRENGKTSTECEFRVKLLPTAYYGDGTNATVSATNKTIVDISKTWIENEKKGWSVSIKFDSGTTDGTVTASTKKLQVSPSPAWTDDEWIGYYCYYNGYYYYITDNDADELTLSDPNGTLSDASNVTWSITKSFKVESNTSTTLNLNDDDGDLVSGTYDYFIDYILCKVRSPGFSYTQGVYSYDEAKKNLKSGYSIIFEEID